MDRLDAVPSQWSQTRPDLLLQGLRKEAVCSKSASLLTFQGLFPYFVLYIGRQLPRGDWSDFVQTSWWNGPPQGSQLWYQGRGPNGTSWNGHCCLSYKLQDRAAVTSGTLDITCREIIMETLRWRKNTELGLNGVRALATRLRNLFRSAPTTSLTCLRSFSFFPFSLQQLNPRWWVDLFCFGIDSLGFVWRGCCWYVLGPPNHLWRIICSFWLDFCCVSYVDSLLGIT